MSLDFFFLDRILVFNRFPIRKCNCAPITGRLVHIHIHICHYQADRAAQCARSPRSSVWPQLHLQFIPERRAGRNPRRVVRLTALYPTHTNRYPILWLAQTWLWLELELPYSRISCVCVCVYSKCCVCVAVSECVCVCECVYYLICFTCLYVWFSV